MGLSIQFYGFVKKMEGLLTRVFRTAANVLSYKYSSVGFKRTLSVNSRFISKI